MENLQRIRIMNILREMESAIHSDSSMSKIQALDAIRTIDRLWDELKGEEGLQEKLARAANYWEKLPYLREHLQRLREQLHQA